MIAMIRAWLRSWLGISENTCTGRFEALDAKMDALALEMDRLKTLRAFREETKRTTPVIDWERVQADFAANPENYKEN